jgi:outer membrane protein assembly factor BamB
MKGIGFGKRRLAIIAGLTLALLAACAENELILPGDREPIREDGQVEAPDRAVPLRLPAAATNADWTHKNGGPSHLTGHPALSRNLTHLWSVPIGEGNATKQRLSADPVVAGGRIFTQDAVAGVRAFDTSGKLLWSADLTPASDKYAQASGGGLAFGGGRLFATTGYGEVIALNPATGAIFWRHKMGAAISAAPVVIGDHVIVVARNNIAQSLSQSYGRIEWEQRSSGEDPGVVGAGAPAALPRLAVLPFTNGELIAALTLNGQRVWSTAVTGTRVGLARSEVADISGDPVIAGDTIYAANQSGRLVSVDRRTGERNWTAQDGSYSPVLPVAGSVFMITDTAELKRLDAKDGSQIWSVELREYVPVRRRWRREPLDAYVYYGPVLAGGRLIVAGSDGVMRNYDPETSAPLSTFEIPGGAASHVAIAGGRLYIVSGDGKLHAFQ